MEIIYKQIVPKIKFLRVNCGKFEPETFQSVGANATAVHHPAPHYPLLESIDSEASLKASQKIYKKHF